MITSRMHIISQHHKTRFTQTLSAKSHQVMHTLTAKLLMHILMTKTGINKMQRCSETAYRSISTHVQTCSRSLATQTHTEAMQAAGIMTGNRALQRLLYWAAFRSVICQCSTTASLCQPRLPNPRKWTGSTGTSRSQCAFCVKLQSTWAESPLVMPISVKCMSANNATGLRPAKVPACLIG